jgi:hypothetical protein
VARHVDLGQVGHGAVDRQATQCAHGLDGDLLEACTIEGLLRSQSHHQYALGHDAFGRVQHDRGAGLAGDVAALDLALDRAVRGGVHAGRCAGEHAVLIDAHHHAGGVGGFGSGGAEAELESHVVSCKKGRERSGQAKLGVCRALKGRAKPFILSHVEDLSP